MTPAAPTLTPLCGEQPLITAPDDPYFTYTTEYGESVATVSATLKDGLTNIEVDPDAQLLWTFDTSFTPVEFPPSDLSFFYWTYNWDAVGGIMLDGETASYLDEEDAVLELETSTGTSAWYGVFDASGDRIPELGEVGYAFVTHRTYSVEQSGIDLVFTFIDSVSYGGLPSAQAHFERLGLLPEGATVRMLENTESSLPTEATMSTIVTDDCGRLIGMNGRGYAGG